MSKIRLNISADKDLVEFIKVFAAENRTTVAEIFTQYVLTIKRKTEGERTEAILAHPAFQEAMEQAQNRLQNGSAVWHAYEDVFGD